jgi:5-methyltetrahydropteroyltriglutamate--homocysteine methyltransferase
MTDMTTLRADHIGSFLRPPDLLEAAVAAEQGRLDPGRLRELEDAAILRVLDLQREAGVGVFTDGEYRRRWYSGAWEASLEGLTRTEEDELARPGLWHGESGELAAATAREVAPSYVVRERVRQRRRLAGDEVAFLHQHAPGPIKITLTGVNQPATRWFRPGVTDAVYPTWRALRDDLLEILRGEVQALAADGVSYLQLDSLAYVIQLAPENRWRLERAGANPDEVLAETIASDSAGLASARDAGVTVGLHMCRGNNRSAWAAEGSYEAIAERAFSELQVDRLLLEYDTERAGSFEPLRFVPEDKVVVLGLISTKMPQLESPDDLLRRIEDAGRYVPVERLALSPQCGFASTRTGNLLSWDDQRRKLELVVEVARRVWG